MKPITFGAFAGRIAGPYGRFVPLYRIAGTSSCAFTLDGEMDMAGIYRPEDREACAREMGDRHAIRDEAFASILSRYGEAPPSVKLKQTDVPVYPGVVGRVRRESDDLATALLECRNWIERSDVILGFLAREREIRENEGVVAGLPENGLAYLTIATGVVLTSALEQLGETDIQFLEAAAFYALSFRPAWIGAGVEWLRPHRETWFREWARERPEWQAYARFARDTHGDLPAWIVEGEAK